MREEGPKAGNGIAWAGASRTNAGPGHASKLWPRPEGPKQNVDGAAPTGRRPLPHQNLGLHSGLCYCRLSARPKGFSSVQIVAVNSGALPGMSEFLHEQLTAGRGQCHDEIVVGLIALR